MAVVDPKTRARVASDATEGTEVKDRVVDILQDKSLAKGSKMRLAVKDGRPMEDAWEFAAPPEAGRYNLKLFLAKEACVQRYMDEKNPDPNDIYYTVNLECKLTDEAYKGVTVFSAVSTRVGRGKNISTGAGMLWKLGYKVPEEIDHYSLAKLLVQVMMKEPTLDAECDWQGWSKEDSRVAYPNMASFPIDRETGKHAHIVEYQTKAKQIETIRANLKVNHWYGKKDEEVAPKGQGQARSTAAGVQMSLAEPEQSAPAHREPTPISKPMPVAAPTPVAPALEDDLLSQLEEA